MSIKSVLARRGVILSTGTEKNLANLCFQAATELNRTIVDQATAMGATGVADFDNVAANPFKTIYSNVHKMNTEDAALQSIATNIRRNVTNIELPYLNGEKRGKYRTVLSEITRNSQKYENAIYGAIKKEFPDWVINLEEQNLGLPESTPEYTKPDGTIMPARVGMSGNLAGIVDNLCKEIKKEIIRPLLEETEGFDKTALLAFINRKMNPVIPTNPAPTA